MNKVFKCKLTDGQILFFTVNGENSFYISTDGEHATDEICGLLYRNETYEVRAWGAINPDTGKFNLDPIQSLRITAKWTGKKWIEASEAAIKKFYEVILEAANSFIKENEKEVRAAWLERAKTDRKAQIISLCDKNEKLRAEINANEKEINILSEKYSKLFEINETVESFC